MIRPLAPALCLAFLAAVAARAEAPVVALEVDLREAPRRLFRARVRIPVKPGPLDLVYPKWIPGNHRPTGPIGDLSGLSFTAGGRTLEWRRDPVDLWRFHLEVPAGAREVEVALELLSPPPKAPESQQGGSEATANLLLLSWHQVLLVPAGASMQETRIRARVHLPEGWRFASALPSSGTAADLTFAETTLETLVDSPLLAGAHFREVALGPAAGPPHFLEIAAESEEALALSPEQQKLYERLAAEGLLLFGAHHYDAYRFLITLSDSARHTGLEHHASSDDRVEERTFLDKDLFALNSTLWPHEFTHSWNGKFRRPVGLSTRDYQEPLQGDLLWVYEGLTDYLGGVLAARSGLASAEQTREALAFTASTLQLQRGRAWRPLEDTAVAVQLSFTARSDWQARRRSADYYPEGDLLWLEVDAILREGTAGRASIDTFCQRFFGGESSAPRVHTYGRADVIAALQAIVPYDWAGFFTARVSRIAPDAPLGGIERGGYLLAYDGKENLFQALLERTRLTIDLRASIGLDVDAKDGSIADVIPQSVADSAGLGPQMKIIAVNGRRFNPARLRAAVEASKRTGAITLVVDNAEEVSTRTLKYDRGLRYPHLVREAQKPDLLSAILAPRTGAQAGAH